MARRNSPPMRSIASGGVATGSARVEIGASPVAAPARLRQNTGSLNPAALGVNFPGCAVRSGPNRSDLPGASPHPPALYQERTGQATTREVIDRCLDDLAQARTLPGESPLAKRIELAQACLDGAVAAAIAGHASRRARGSSRARHSRARDGPRRPAGHGARSGTAYSFAHRRRERGQVRPPEKSTRPRQASCASNVPHGGMFDSILFAYGFVLRLDAARRHA